MPKKTLVLGASENPSRYSFLAIQKLRKYQHPVLAIGSKKGMVADVPVLTETIPLEAIDTVTLYLSPQNQTVYIPYILSLHPKRIIFNPGTENEPFKKQALENGIEAIEACTLVMLGTNQY
jgi:predicted CoA-binding protein